MKMNFGFLLFLLKKNSVLFDEYEMSTDPSSLEWKLVSDAHWNVWIRFDKNCS